MLEQIFYITGIIAFSLWIIIFIAIITAVFVMKKRAEQMKQEMEAKVSAFFNANATKIMSSVAMGIGGAIFSRFMKKDR